jgi:hypothetical protein
MRRRVTQCLVARNGNDVSWEFPGPTNLSLSRKRTYVWNLCGTDGQSVGDRCENCTKKRQTLEGESRRIGW